MGTVSVYAFGRGVKSKHPSATRRKVAGIAEGLETYHVGAKDAFQNFLSPAEATVKLAAWEGNMEEESDVDVRDVLAEETRKQEEVKVVNNDNVTRPV
jgi:hypothetical protein